MNAPISDPLAIAAAGLDQLCRTSGIKSQFIDGFEVYQPGISFLTIKTEITYLAFLKVPETGA